MWQNLSSILLCETFYTFCVLDPLGWIIPWGSQTTFYKFETLFSIKLAIASCQV